MSGPGRILSDIAARHLKMPSQELIKQFVEMTGATESVASFYLERLVATKDGSKHEMS